MLQANEKPALSGQILIVDDHEFVRRGLRALLSTRPDWVICGEAVDGLEAVEMAKAMRPDVILMDISMPRMNGLEATRIIRKEVPESKIVIVSQNDPTIASRQTWEIDATAYVAKSDLSRSLLPTLDSVVGLPESERPAEFEPRAFSGGWLSGGGEL